MNDVRKVTGCIYGSISRFSSFEGAIGGVQVVLALLLYILSCHSATDHVG